MRRRVAAASSFVSLSAGLVCCLGYLQMKNLGPIPRAAPLALSMLLVNAILLASASAQMCTPPEPEPHPETVPWAEHNKVAGGYEVRGRMQKTTLPKSFLLRWQPRHCDLTCASRQLAKQSCLNLPPRWRGLPTVSQIRFWKWGWLLVRRCRRAETDGSKSNVRKTTPLRLRVSRTPAPSAGSRVGRHASSAYLSSADVGEYVGAKNSSVAPPFVGGGGEAAALSVMVRLAVCQGGAGRAVSLYVSWRGVQSSEFTGQHQPRGSCLPSPKVGRAPHVH